MRIRREQMEVLSADLTSRLREAFLKQLRLHYPATTRAHEDSQLRAWLQKDLDAAKTLQIVEPQDLWRFVSLRHLPEYQSGSKLIKTVVKKVLSNANSPAKERLDFLQRQALRSLGEHPWLG